MPAIGLVVSIKKLFSDMKERGILDLVDKKESALVDFLGCYPSIVSKACPTESIAKGFILNGMIDSTSLSTPDISMILNTCNDKQSMNAHHQLIESSFPRLYEEFSQKGHLGDKILEECGFGCDMNYAHETTHRYSDCETYQRSKCLSHSFQREQRIRAAKNVLLKAR